MIACSLLEFLALTVNALNEMTFTFIDSFDGRKRDCRKMYFDLSCFMFIFLILMQSLGIIV